MDSMRKQVFLFTDIEDSTARWEKSPEAMERALVTHDHLIEDLVQRNGGRIVKHTGDGFFAVFPTDAPWAAAAIAIQSGIAAERWQGIEPLTIRIGVHAGTAVQRGDDLFGRAVNRAQRVMSTASGGQTLVTGEARRSASVPNGSTCIDLGMHRLKDLGQPEQLFELRGSDRAEAEFPPLSTLSSVPNNLPAQLTPFVGRRDDLARLESVLLDDSRRLITLTGPGGAGKTRLALQAAANVCTSFQDGVYFVPLESVTSAEGIVSGIADALGYAFRTSDALNELINHLSQMRALLILDNYEHLAYQASGTAAEILIGARSLEILITSRERLRLRGEQVVELGAMQYEKAGAEGDADTDAVHLFLEAAARVTPEPFDTPGEMEAVVKVCERAEGLPLAIELAASWTRFMKVHEILADMTSPGFLELDFADMPERHRGIGAVFEYSWRLLSPEEKSAFQSLSVLRGRFDKIAAQRVGGVRFGHLVALVDKLLVHQTGTGRYSLHPLIRVHVQQRLAEDPGMMTALLKRHSEHYLGMVADLEPDLIRGDRGGAVQHLGRELENIEAAWINATENGMLDLIGSCLKGLTSLLAIKGQFRQAAGLLGLAIDSLDREEADNQLLRAYLLSNRGWAESHYEPLRKFRVSLERSVELFRRAGDQSALAYGLNNYANVLNVHGEDEQAGSLYAESLEIQRKLGDPHGISAVLNNLGVLAERRKDLSGARQLYEEALQVCRRQDNTHGVSVCLSNLSTVARDEGRMDEATDMLQEALEIEETIGDEINTSLVRSYMTELLLLRGELDEARSLCLEAYKAFQAGGHPWGMVRSEMLLSLIALEQGRLPEALTIVLNSLDLLEEHRWTNLFAETMSIAAELLAQLGRPGEARTVASVAVSSGPLQKYHQERMARVIEQLRHHLELYEERESAQLGRSFDMDDAIRFVRSELRQLLGQ